MNIFWKLGIALFASVFASALFVAVAAPQVFWWIERTEGLIHKSASAYGMAADATQNAVAIRSPVILFLLVYVVMLCAVQFSARTSTA